jgi:RNA polymerase sigma-70 factor (sigma-E family)
MPESDQAFVEFVRGTQHRLMHLADLLVRDRGHAEDLVQKALIKVYLAWPRLRAGNPEAYARAVIVRANIDRWRRGRIRNESLTGEVPETEGRSDHAGAVVDRQVVRAALRLLTARERAAVVLRYYCDLSESQIAAEMKVAPRTVKSTLARGLSKLRQSVALEMEVRQ